MIDVIVPVKGRPSKLGRALKSLEGQTYQEFEVTVVNDHSSPEDRNDIAQICAAYKGPIKLIDSKGTGAPAARNFGFGNTQNEYVLWFDSDDILLPNKLEHDLQIFKSNTFDFAVSRAQHLEKGGGWLIDSGEKHLTPTRVLFNSLSKRCVRLSQERSSKRKTSNGTKTTSPMMIGSSAMNALSNQSDIHFQTQ